MSTPTDIDPRDLNRQSRDSRVEKLQALVFALRADVALLQRRTTVAEGVCAKLLEILLSAQTGCHGSPEDSHRHPLLGDASLDKLRECVA
jgi:hypothetical protein